VPRRWVAASCVGDDGPLAFAIATQEAARREGRRSEGPEPPERRRRPLDNQAYARTRVSRIRRTSLVSYDTYIYWCSY
jgi:hypothetical protein